jgi:hypothetical protein
MRGEETQLLGVTEPDFTGLVCIPGTHSNGSGSTPAGRDPARPPSRGGGLDRRSVDRLRLDYARPRGLHRRGSPHVAHHVRQRKAVRRQPPARGACACQRNAFGSKTRRLRGRKRQTELTLVH